uniref:Uncharacterized protein n=1 Tax=Onchocerca volvulus TaxID=6282 RepID=A0A8R1XQQ7_ONCVO
MQLHVSTDASSVAYSAAIHQMESIKVGNYEPWWEWPSWLKKEKPIGYNRNSKEISKIKKCVTPYHTKNKESLHYPSDLNAIGGTLVWYQKYIRFNGSRETNR